jgi:hypothetical protein
MPMLTARAAARPRVPAASKDWHPIAKRMYLSLKSSGQSAFFEASDWATAQLAAEATSRLLTAEKFSAMLLAAVDAIWARLLMTEADRRRLRVELERPKEDADAAAAVTALDEFRSRFSG